MKVNFIGSIRKAEVVVLRGVLFVWKRIIFIAKKVAVFFAPLIKAYWKLALITLVVLYLVGGLVFGVRLYRQKRFDNIDRYASVIYPFPVANVGRSLVFDKELQYKVYWSKKFGTAMQVEIPANLAQSITSEMVDDAATMQQASRLGVRITNQDINDVFSNSISSTMGSEEQATSFIEQNYGMSVNQFKQLMVPKIALEKVRDQSFVKVVVRHILIKDDNKANDILKQLQGGADFATVAKDNSEDTASKDNGGLLADGEFIFRDSGLIPEAEDAIFKLKAGETSGVVKSSLGNSIFKVEQRQGTIDAHMTDWLAGVEKSMGVRNWVKLS
jgi:foldase protein PrsA